MAEKYTRDPHDPSTWPFTEPKGVEEAHARIREQDGLVVQFSDRQLPGDPDARRIRNFAIHERSQLNSWLSRAN